MVEIIVTAHFEGEQTMVCDTNDFPFGQLRTTLDYFRKPLMVQLNCATYPKPKSPKVSEEVRTAVEVVTIKVVPLVLKTLD